MGLVSALPAGLGLRSGSGSANPNPDPDPNSNSNPNPNPDPDPSRSVSFSYGKALQKTTIVTWMGDVRNNGIAQDAILNRCKANHEACQGTYVKGSCASVSVDGNIAQAAGAY